MNSEFKNRVFNVASAEEFSQMALALFKWQVVEVEVYKTYVNAIGVKPDEVTRIDQIPFLPISFFKTHEVKSGTAKTETIFTSSGTSGQSSSQHFVADLKLYERSFTHAFQKFYGQVNDYCILALLPAYLERTGSSLVFMVNNFIEKSGHRLSGFHLNDHEELRKKLISLKAEGQKTLLIGVSFGLLDFIETEGFNWPELLVMETGGMKGRRKEMIRSELHHHLKSGFGVSQIHSEYGMTELLSQAYSYENGIYNPPPWMKVLTRQTADPFAFAPNGSTGGINIIDLANIYSCAFIATQDLGKVYANGSFEVLGRFDEAEVRGCNLMV